MSDVVCGARSLLFVPASRMDRLGKALQSPADAVIVDLEDAVPPAGKELARELAARGLAHLDERHRSRIVVRINPDGSPWHEADLALVTALRCSGIDTVMLPKSEDPRSVREIASALGPGVRVVALIESLAGLDNVDALARQAPVCRLAFGHLDFQLDLGMHCTEQEGELAFARNALVAASRRARLCAPIDGVTVEIDDDARLRLDTLRARAFGFGGKLCIHPRQVLRVHEALRPSDAEVAWARRVLEASRAGAAAAVSVDGRMVDLPVIRSAEALLAALREPGEG